MVLLPVPPAVASSEVSPWTSSMGVSERKFRCPLAFRYGPCFTSWLWIPVLSSDLVPSMMECEVEVWSEIFSFRSRLILIFIYHRNPNQNRTGSHLHYFWQKPGLLSQKSSLERPSDNLFGFLRLAAFPIGGDWYKIKTCRGRNHCTLRKMKQLLFSWCLLLQGVEYFKALNLLLLHSFTHRHAHTRIWSALIIFSNYPLSLLSFSPQTPPPFQQVSFFLYLYPFLVAHCL